MTVKDVIREHHGLLSDWRLQQCLKTLSHALERVISLLKSGYTYSSIMVPELTTEHVAYLAPHRCLVAFSLLSRVNLSGADLSGAALRDATVTQEQVHQARPGKPG